MSTSAGETGDSEQDVLRRLELMVGRALQRIRELETRLAEAERRATDLDQMLFDVSGGEVQPTLFVDRLRALERENDDLRDRLVRGKAGVERLMAKIRFLEEQR